MTSSPNNNNEKQHQWVEVTQLSSFTTKWNLFSHFKNTFGNVLNVTTNDAKRSARILFETIESGQKCVDWFSANPLLDGECIQIDLCSDSNLTPRNAKKCLDSLSRKLHGMNNSEMFSKLKFCAENIDKMTPFNICKSQSKILQMLSASKKAVFVMDAFADIGIDSYVFSDDFNCIRALAQSDIFYQNLVFNMKLFGRYQIPIKCLKASIFEIYHNLDEHIVYIDAFKMNQSIKYNDSCPDIAYYDKSTHSTSYLSTFCNNIYAKNKDKNLMLIAVKVPNYFIISEFIQKIQSAHIIVFDFGLHKFMILDFEHTINELMSLEFACKNKKKEMCFRKSFVFQNDNLIKTANIKKQQQKFTKMDTKNDEIGMRVKHVLRQIGFKKFGVEHSRNFAEKLKAQIISKQKIRQKIECIDLVSKFKQIEDIKEFIASDQVWIAPNVIGPRFLMFAFSKWTIFVDEDFNFYYHESFNDLYKNIFFESSLQQNNESKLKTVSVIDGFLIPTNYFDAKQKCATSPLQFWILDVLSFKNQTFMTMQKRFSLFGHIIKAYKSNCKYLQNGPISIHSLHFEAYQNKNNLIKFVKQRNDGFVYRNNEGNEYLIDGFVAIKNNHPCTIHDRANNHQRCVLWKCKFNDLLTQYFVYKQQQQKTQNNAMFQK